MMTSLMKLSGICIIGLSLHSSLVTAGECKFIELVKSKSSGTEIVKSRCSNENGLTIAGQLSLAAGGRAWIRSGHKEASAHQQVICQNKSLATIDLKITQLQAPWISVTNIENCNTWSKNRLSCDIAQGQKLFCIRAELKQPISRRQAQERTTSVAMRSITQNKKISSGLQALSGGLVADIRTLRNTLNIEIAMLQPEIDLCRQLFQTEKNIKLLWNINTLGEVSESSVLNSEADNFGSCLNTIISTHVYSKSLANSSFIYQF